MKKHFIWLNLTIISCSCLFHLAMPLTVRADCHQAVRRQLREGTRDIIDERREVAREILESDSRSEVRREIREGVREVQQERRQVRREVRRTIRRKC